MAAAWERALTIAGSKPLPTTPRPIRRLRPRELPFRILTHRARGIFGEVATLLVVLAQKTRTERGADLQHPVALERPA